LIFTVALVSRSTSTGTVVSINVVVGGEHR
jgi:hypothetical protein